MLALLFSLVLVAGQVPIVARVGESPPTKSPLLIEAGEEVTIAATLPPDRAPDLRWYLLDPLAADYDNLKACGVPDASGCHQPLSYERREIPEISGHRSRVRAADG